VISVTSPKPRSSDPSLVTAGCQWPSAPGGEDLGDVDGEAMADHVADLTFPATVQEPV
jgi:hypothetical protein